MLNPLTLHGLHTTQFYWYLIFEWNQFTLQGEAKKDLKILIEYLHFSNCIKFEVFQKPVVFLLSLSLTSINYTLIILLWSICIMYSWSNEKFSYWNWKKTCSGHANDLSPRLEEKFYIYVFQEFGGFWLFMDEISIASTLFKNSKFLCNITFYFDKQIYQVIKRPILYLT